MKLVIRKFGLLSLLLVVALFVQNAGATPTEILPDSSYYEGRSYFSRPATGLEGRIDFAVYDTDDGGDGPGQLDAAEFGVAPGTGRYIYAYQIFVEDAGTKILDYFGIFGIGEGALAHPINDNIGWMNDSPLNPTKEGVEPDEAYIALSTTYGIMGVWEFDTNLVTGQHSWLLVLRSDNPWTIGGYTFSDTFADGEPLPNPEPATLVLLGLHQSFRRKWRRLYEDSSGGERAAPAPGNSQYQPVCAAKANKKNKAGQTGLSADPAAVSNKHR